MQADESWVLLAQLRQQRNQISCFCCLRLQPRLIHRCQHGQGELPDCTHRSPCPGELSVVLPKSAVELLQICGSPHVDVDEVRACEVAFDEIHEHLAHCVLGNTEVHDMHRVQHKGLDAEPTNAKQWAHEVEEVVTLRVEEGQIARGG